jgi:hypothetical protein
MFKVIVERPRLRCPRPCGSAYPRGSLRNLFERDLEAAPSRLGMRFPHKEKHLNENLAPLLRFLRGQVGRPWDSVRSEIAEHLSVGSAVQKHVLDHVADFVERNVIMVDGLPHSLRWGGLTPIGRSPYRTLYVCPRTGLLRQVRPAREARPAPDRVAVVDAVSEVWRIAGKLQTARFRRLPPRAEARDACFDVILARHLTAVWFGPDERLTRFYGRADRYAAELREPGRRELRIAERAIRAR